MAYDPEDLKEKEKKASRSEPDTLTPEEIAERESELRDNYGEDDRGGWNYLKDSYGDRQRGLRRESMAAQKEKDDADDERLGGALRDALDDDGQNDTGFFKADDGKGSGLLQKGRNRLSSFRKNRKLTYALAAGSVSAVVAGVGIFGFLGIFKLESLLNKIDAQSFARLNATFDRRSDRWVRTYVMLRLAEWEGTTNPDQDNLFFKSDRVDNDNPIRDWYRTLRTGRFEQEVFEKNGFTFSSMIDRNGNPKAALVTFKPNSSDIQFDFDPIKEFGNGDFDATVDLFERIDRGDLSALNQLGDKLDLFVDTQVLSSDKEARKVIKEIVNDNTRAWNVFKRRHVRKDIQNKIGVRDWRFFETTRDKIDDRKIAFQKKLLNKLLPEDTKSGKFLLCIFGAGQCPRNADPNNEANRSGNALDGRRTADEGGRQQIDPQTGEVIVDADGNPISGEVGSNSSLGNAVSDAVTEAGDNATAEVIQKTFMRNILSKLNIATAAVSAVGTLDMISRVDANITSGALKQVAVLAKGAQAMAAYTTFAIARDQARTGELTADEYGLLLETIEGAERSEAYDYFFNDGRGGTDQVTKDEYCEAGFDKSTVDYTFTCPEYQVGSADNAELLQAWYQGTIGYIIGPIMDAYRSVRNSFLSGVFDLVNSISGVVDGIVSTVTNSVLAAVGLSGKIEEFTAWISGKVASFLGGAPILAGSGSPPGLVLTMIAQGAEVTAENTKRASGAARTTAETGLYAKELELAFLEEQRAGQSFYERYFDTSNVDSFAARSLLNISNFDTGSLASIPKFIGGMFSNIGSIFGMKAGAEVNNNPNLSGIDTYDFPVYCVENEPLDFPAASELTNADDLVNAAGEPFIASSDVTYELLNNYDAFWRKIYERVGDNDVDPQRVLDIYNCETLNQRVRGSLGFTSGYTDDGGLEDGAAGNPSTGDNATINCANAIGNAKIVCAAQQYTGIRYSNGGTKWNTEWSVSNTINRLNGGGSAENYLNRNNNDIATLRETAFIDCSGYTNLSLYVAHNYKTPLGCSGQYTTDTNKDGVVDGDSNMRIVDFNSLQPGDFLTISNACNTANTPGHIAIFVSRLPNGNIRTLESSAGTNDTDGTRTSGYYERPITYFKFASRYVGTGSGL